MSAAEARATPMVEHALGWARLGMPVFPVYEMVDGKCACGGSELCEKLGAQGKHPRIKANLVLATTEERKIREWWGRWPNANIGIATGNELPGGGYLMVVDEDPRHDGDQTMALLEQKHGPLPSTPRVVTGSVGTHTYLRTKKPVTSRAGSLGQGIDVRGAGGYVVAPPSNHKSGGSYQRDAGSDFDDVEIADAPEWVVILADPPRSEPKTAKDTPDAFIEGGRHDAMLSIAGAMRRKGLRPSEMLPSLLAINRERCRPPLDEVEIQKLAESATWAPQDPATGEDRWNVMPTSQIFEKLPDYPWLIPGMHLAPGRPTLLNGYADVGKTVVAMTFGLSVATGWPLWELFTPTRQGRVLHLNGEIGTYLARERYQRLTRAARINADDLIASGRLLLSNYPNFTLDDKDAEERLSQLFDGYQLVIIDSLRAFSGRLDENGKEISGPLYMLARVSNRTGATVLVLHHNRKPSKDDVGGAKMAISGHNSILGAAECAFVMTSTGKGEPILVNHERSPIGRPVGDFGLSIEDVGKGGDERWGLKVSHLEPEQMEAMSERSSAARERVVVEKNKLRVVAQLERVAGVYRGRLDGLRAMVGIGKGPLDKALAELVSERVVERAGTHNAPEWRLVGWTLDSRNRESA